MPDPRDVVGGVRCTVKETMERFEMVRPGDLVLVGVSGGPDSMCLLDCLLYLAPQLQIGIWVGHLHHGMRGAAADRDAAVVAGFASERGVPVTVVKQDVPGLASDLRIGVEEAGRVARYSFLRELARRVGATRIATAHHMNDQAETVLMRLLRGSGTPGLAGIPPVREEIIRPLIKVERREIEEYVRERNLPTVVDVYNYDMRYLRNRVRYQLIPLLQELNPRVVRTLSRTADLLRWDEDALARRASSDFASGSFREGRLTYVKKETIVSKEPAIASRIVRKAFSEVLDSHELPTPEVVEALLYGIKERPSGCYDLGSGVKVVDGGEWLIFVPPVPRRVSKRMRIPGSVYVEELGVSLNAWFPSEEESCLIREEIRTGRIKRRSHAGSEVYGRFFLENRVFIDYNELTRGSAEEPYLTVRTWKPGDRFYPLGMELKTKKLADLFLSAGVPRWCREFVPIVERNGDIVWVVGIRLDERFKVDENTRVLLAMEVRPLLRPMISCANIRESLKSEDYYPEEG